MIRVILILAILASTITTYAAPIPDGFTDDTSPLLDLTGSWSTIANTQSYGASFQLTTDSTAILSLETYAPALSILFFYDPAGDSAEICIDAVDCVTVSMLGSTTSGDIELLDLGTGLKTITISKVTADTSAITIDAIYTHPVAQTADRAVSENTFTYDGETYNGYFDYVITAGDSLIIILLSILITLGLANFVYALWDRKS